MLGGTLVETDAAIGNASRLGRFDAGQERVHGKVPAFETVVEMRKNAELFAMRIQRLEQFCCLVIRTFFFGPEVAGIHAELIADTNHPFRWGL